MGAANPVPAATTIAAFLPYLIVINIAVGLLVAYAVRSFRSGRWVAEQTHAHEALHTEIGAVSTQLLRELGDIKVDLVEEHRLRRDFIDRVNIAVGKLETALARHDERLKALERS